MKKYDEFLNFLNNLNNKPKLLLHSCCGPCSSSVLELLTKYFDVTVLYYNPNIYPEDEYKKRLNEQKKLLKELNIKLLSGDYNYELYKDKIKGLEDEKEGGLRCEKCIEFRMENAALIAKEKGFDFFTTTLSVSPHKNSDMINKIGYELEEKYDIKYLYSDFKKKDGYKRSIELSKEYNLYRQNYCGCQFSLNWAKKD